MKGGEHREPLEKVISGTSSACVICGGSRDCTVREELQTVCHGCIDRGRKAREVRGIAYVTDGLRKMARCEKFCDASCGKCRVMAETLVREVEVMALALLAPCVSCGDDRDHPAYCKTCIGRVRMVLGISPDDDLNEGADALAARLAKYESNLRAIAQGIGKGFATALAKYALGLIEDLPDDVSSIDGPPR